MGAVVVPTAAPAPTSNKKAPHNSSNGRRLFQNYITVGKKPPSPTILSTRQHDCSICCWSCSYTTLIGTNHSDGSSLQCGVKFRCTIRNHGIVFGGVENCIWDFFSLWKSVLKRLIRAGKKEVFQVPLIVCADAELTVAAAAVMVVYTLQYTQFHLPPSPLLFPAAAPAQY